MRLKLIKKRASGINTYLEVDSEGKPIVKKRAWSTRPEQQRYLRRDVLKHEIKFAQ